MRITMITWLVMAIICILITAFTLINSEVWVVKQMDSISGGTVIDMYGQSVESGKTEYYKDEDIDNFQTDTINPEDNYSSEKHPEEFVQIDDSSKNIVQFFCKTAYRCCNHTYFRSFFDLLCCRNIS